MEIAEGGPSSQTGQIFVGDSVLQIDGKHRESCAVRFAMLSTSACLSGLAGISVFGKKQQEVMDLLYGRADTHSTTRVLSLARLTWTMPEGGGAGILRDTAFWPKRTSNCSTIPLLGMRTSEIRAAPCPLRQ